MDCDDTLHLPASLRDAAERVARADGTTLNQFVAAAVAEKLSALKTLDLFAERGARADLAAFDRFMARSGGVPPDEGDRWDPDPSA